MKQRNFITNVGYGLAHTKEYQPTVVSKFLIDKDSKGRCIQRHSDVYLFLRDQKLQKSVGLETLKEYVESFRTPETPAIDLTDEQLMSLIPPKDLYTQTERRMYMEYLESKSKEIQESYKELHETGSRYKSYLRKYSSIANPEKSD